jgi:hypothetical protein
MGVPVSLREDFDAGRLRGLAKRTPDGPQVRRLLALAAIYGGDRERKGNRAAGVARKLEKAALRAPLTNGRQLVR